MKRTGFKKTSYQECVEQARASQERQRVRRTTKTIPSVNAHLKRASKTIGKGKKTKAWDSQRAWLKNEFEKRGITSCELNYKGCWKDDSLSFAHSRKRSDPLYDPYEVILACAANCHAIIERKTHEAMHSTVMEVINARGGVIRP